jgi:hypothetical protein
MKKQKKTLRELSTELQTLCHEGYSDCEVIINRLNGVYDVGEIQPYSKPDGSIFFVIKAESCQ